ncbi:MAG: DUF1015 family protein [Sporichthyaceae bacterium]
MPALHPFPGIRYADDDLAALTAPPYDVIDAQERAALAAQHRHNVVAIDLPVADGDGGGDAYAAAAKTWERWRAIGVLIEDAPSLYPYRMTFTDETGTARSTLGVLGALGIDAQARADVLPHEHTTPKAHSDRLQLLRSTQANLSAIWGLSLTAGLTALIDLERAEVLGSWRDPEGIGHELWRLDDPATTKALTEAIGANPLVIADGHHRYSTALSYADEAGAPPGADATLCLVVELDHDQLTVAPIHRLISGLPPEADLAGALAADFEVGALEPLPGADVVSRLVTDGALALVTPDGMRLLRPRTALGGVEPLDSVRVAEAAGSWPAHELRYQHGVAHAVAAVTGGRAQAAILLRPVSVEQIRSTADARGLMPPKSTFFWPKPRTGAVFRDLSIDAEDPPCPNR